MAGGKIHPATGTQTVLERVQSAWQHPRTPVLVVIVLLGTMALLAAKGFAAGNDGDFVHFYAAGQAVLHGQDLYSAGQRGYIYPPFLAVFMSLLCLLPKPLAGVLWTGLNAGLTLLCIIICLREVSKRFGQQVMPSEFWWWVAWVAFLLSDKILAVFRLGQTDVFMLLAVILALMNLGKRGILAGVILGVAFNVKYQTLVFLPYFVLRGRWREVFGFIVSSVLTAFSTALIFGWQRNLHYLTTGFAGLLEMLGVSSGRPAANIHELTWENSVALPSAWARIAGQGGMMAVVGLVAAVALVCLLIGAWMYRYHKVPLFFRHGSVDDMSSTGRAVTVLEWAGLIMVALAFSPQTTERHLYLLIFVVALGVVLWHAARGFTLRILVSAALGAGYLALILPPGGVGLYEERMMWRAVGGPMWVWLCVYFSLLWCGLAVADTLRRDGTP